MPDTIAPAPNRMKHPRITVAPKRQFIRPVSIMKPTAATAITATAVATFPSSVPCSQAKADTIGPLPAGSARSDWANADRGAKSMAGAAMAASAAPLFESWVKENEFRRTGPSIKAPVAYLHDMILTRVVQSLIS